jgi:hypothetical protein
MSFPGFDLNSFKANFDGGARAYLFMYKPEFPSSINLETTYDTLVKSGANVKDFSDTFLNSAKQKKIAYLVKTTSYPNRTIEEMTLNWKGFKHKIGGTAVYDDWTISFNTDKAYEVRKDFERWSDLIVKIGENYKTEDTKYGEPSDYLKDQTLYTLDNKGDISSTVKLIGAWPKVVGEIALDHQTIEVSSFEVTFSYQYYEIVS